MGNKISAILVVYNEEEIIERCLKSIKPISDEILILHDGPCKDKTLEICRRYTKNVFVRPHKGLPAMHLAYLFRKVKYNWILKIDADEFLSEPLKKKIKKLIENPKADAYSFRWPYWDGKKHITKEWPTKMPLYRKSKMSFLGFPHWDDPKIKGDITKSEYVLEHRHHGSSGTPTWKEFKKKAIGRYLRIQAEYTLKDYKEIEKFQYPKKDFPLSIKIRRTFPLFSAIPFSLFSFFKVLFSEGAWKEGKPALLEALGCIVYYFYLGVYVFKLKFKSKRFF